MALTRAFPIDQAYPNGSDIRKQFASIFPREGVFPDPITIDPAGIAYAGAGWTVNARPFGASIKRGGAPYSLAYGSALVGNDAIVVSAWTIGAAPASGSRIDRLCIRAKDASQGDSLAGAPTDGPGGIVRAIPEFLTVAGTAGTPGVAPALPAGYEEIAQITTPSGAASAAGSTIVPTYGFAHVLGSPIVVRNYTELDALTGLIALDSAYVVDKDVLLDRVAGGWAPARPNAAGVSRVAAPGVTFNNQTTFAAWPAGADATAMAITFEKFSSSTRLRLRMFSSFELSAGAAQLLLVGLRIQTTDYEVARRQFTAALSRINIDGEIILPGIPRGTLSISPRFRATAASQVTWYVGQDYVSYSIEEIV